MTKPTVLFAAGWTRTSQQPSFARSTCPSCERCCPGRKRRPSFSWKYVVVTATLSDIGPQCSLSVLLQFVEACISDQLLCCLGRQHWRQCCARRKRKGSDARSV